VRKNKYEMRERERERERERQRERERERERSETERVCGRERGKRTWPGAPSRAPPQGISFGIVTTRKIPRER
jgi:hypothetical protein